jgi:hypothetical protein
MPRLNIFAKGNGDVRDVMVALFENGRATWNGINEPLRAQFPGWTARVTHETMTRSDALLAMAGEPIPPALAARDLPLGPFAPASQFSSRLFDTPADVVVLSVQADTMNALARHRDDGHRLYPYGVDGWPAEERAWLTNHYELSPALSPEQSMASLGQIVTRIRATGDPAILIFNMSPIVPWERVHCYSGLGETLAERVRRFGLALADLSREIGISIVDVDAVIAREGAAKLKADAVALTAAGCRVVAAEVVRILADLGRLR